jgi:hypothetical protein
MDARGFVRIALAGALACLLSACWLSEKPLITDGSASEVGFVGKYHADGDGDSGPTDIAIVADGPASYAIASEKDERLPVRFLALKGAWYLMQADSDSDEEGADTFYLYQVLKVVNGDLHFYSSDCEDLTGKFKGMKRDKATVPSCTFSRLDGLKSAALAYVARIERGELAEEPHILARLR